MYFKIFLIFLLWFGWMNLSIILLVSGEEDAAAGGVSLVLQV